LCYQQIKDKDDDVKVGAIFNEQRGLIWWRQNGTATKLSTASTDCEVIDSSNGMLYMDTNSMATSLEKEKEITYIPEENISQVSGYKLSLCFVNIIKSTVQTSGEEYSSSSREYDILSLKKGDIEYQNAKNLLLYSCEYTDVFYNNWKTFSSYLREERELDMII
jgi:exosome complex RNA-binding protein Csl4